MITNKTQNLTSMKNTHILHLVIAVASLTALDAAVNVDRNNVLWEGTYEGDSVNLTTAGTPPDGTTPVFSAFDANTDNRSLIGGSLQMVTGSAGQTQSFSNDFGMVQSNLMTVEWKGSVDINQPFDALTGFGGLIVVADGTYLSFNQYSDQLQVQNAGQTAASFLMNMTQEITFRVTYDGSLATDDWKLYADNSLLWSSGTLVAATFAPVSNRIIFGDYSAGAFYGAANWDYISWTDAGAFAPVPEPSFAMALLVMGGASLIRRRKRASVE